MSWKLRGGHKQETSEGYNLLNFISLIGQTETRNGVTYKINEDGSITLNGTPTGYTSFNLANLRLEAGTYKFSDDQNNNLIFFQAIGQWQTTSQNKVFSVTEDGNSDIYLVVGIGTSTLSNFTLYAMIHEGTEDKPYEPYGTIKPSPKYPSEIKTTVGSNINEFDGELELGSIGNNDGKNYGTAKNTRSKNYLAVEENTTYALSDNINGSFIVHAYDKDKNWLKLIGASNYTGKYIFTTPQQTAYIRFRTNETDLTAKIKLEKNSTVTAYTPPGIGSVEIDVVNNDNTKSQTAIMPIQQELLNGDYIADVEHHEWGKIESYNGETIITDYISTTGELTTGATIYYKLVEPLDLELTEEQQVVRNTKLYTYKNITNISLSDELASIDVEYKKDQNAINKNYENRLAALETASTSEEASKCGNLY